MRSIAPASFVRHASNHAEVSCAGPSGIGRRTPSIWLTPEFSCVVAGLEPCCPREALCPPRQLQRLVRRRACRLTYQVSTAPAERKRERRSLETRVWQLSRNGDTGLFHGFRVRASAFASPRNWG